MVVSDGADEMSDTQPESRSGSLWRIPDWYRRVGLMSWYFIGFAAAVALVAVIIAATSEIVAPLVLGAFMAIVFFPVVDWLANRGLSRALASLAVLVGLAVLLVGVSWFTGVALVDQADELSANLDKAVADIKGWLEDTPVNQELADQVRATTADTGPALTGGLADRAISLVDSAFGFITGAILGTIVFYYLLKDGQTLFTRWLEREDDAEARALYRRIGDRTVTNTQSYFRGRTAMAFVNGAVIGLAAVLLGVPAAGVIAVVNFVGAYIPYLGAFIGGAFAVLMALGEGGIGLALIILGVTLAVNLLLENLLEPVLLGGSLDLHPLLILLATSLGGIIAGMIGLILAAPALAILFDIKRELKESGFFDDAR
jgi:predicted PurR-regulated permease PerM